MMEKRPSPSARSSMDRAIGFYPVGWGFESLRARFGAVIDGSRGTPAQVSLRGDLRSRQGDVEFLKRLSPFFANEGR